MSGETLLERQIDKRGGGKTDNLETVDVGGDKVVDGSSARLDSAVGEDVARETVEVDTDIPNERHDVGYNMGEIDSTDH